MTTTHHIIISIILFKIALKNQITIYFIVLNNTSLQLIIKFTRPIQHYFRIKNNLKYGWIYKYITDEANVKYYDIKIYDYNSMQNM